MDEGLVDTNVFVHAFMNDDRTEECVAFLDGVRSGVTRAEIHPLVVHELTYTFVRYKIFLIGTRYQSTFDLFSIGQV